MGGLARRAAFIASKRDTPEQNTIRLFIAGPYELLDIEEGKSPAARAPQVVGEAYAALQYDAMMLTPGDGEVLGNRLPKTLVPWAMPPGRVMSKTLKRQGLRIGLVFFPVQQKPGQVPSDKDMDDVRVEALRLKASVHVVIGISPWGFAAEQAYLERFSTSPQPIDVLLGGGLGPGSRGKLAAGGITAWVRPYSRGKAVHVIRLGNIPKRQGQAQAKREEDVRFDVVSLDDKIPADRTMDRILAPARASN